MYLKYSDSPINFAEYVDIIPQLDEPCDYGAFAKPKGCWITDDSDFCWKTWCEAEEFELGSLTHKYEAALDESNLLIMRSPQELDKFTEEYGYVCNHERPRFYRDAAISWQRVAQKYDGVIITPYIGVRHLKLDWYHPWDCASGCIWRKRAIKEFKLIEVTEAPAPKVEEDAV